MTAGALAQDVNGYRFSGPYDSSGNLGKAWRGSNIVGDFADGNVVLYDAAGNALISSPQSADAQASGRGLVTAARQELFNGATWDRRYNNASGTLLASSARTTVTTSPQQTNFNNTGVFVFLNITVAAVGTGGLTVRIQGIDPISGNLTNLLVATAAIVAVGIYGYELHPGASTAGTAGTQNVNTRIAGDLPRTWQVTISVGDATSYTYSVGYSYIR